MSDFENDLPPVLESRPASVAPAPATSLLARLLNVLTMPGRVFDEVRDSRHSIWNWLVAGPIYAVSLALFSVVLISMPASHKWWGEQMAGIRQTLATELADALKSGRVTQADADNTLALSDFIARPRTIKIGVMVGGFCFGSFRIFWWAAVLWFLARRVLGTPVPFSKTLEVTGIASVVAMLGNLLFAAMTVNLAKTFSGPDLTLSVSDLNSETFKTLAAFLQNASGFWLVAVLGVGLSRLTGQPWFRAVFPVVAYWIGSELLLLALGVGLMR